MLPLDLTGKGISPPGSRERSKDQNVVKIARVFNSQIAVTHVHCASVVHEQIHFHVSYCVKPIYKKEI